MEDHKRIQTLLHLLLGVEVGITEINQDYLEYFEGKYCYQKAIQPMFAADALRYLTRNMKDFTFYEIVDKLGIRLFFYRFENNTYLVGPYVVDEFDETAIQRFLVKNNIPVSQSIPIQLYYTGIPVLTTSSVQHTVTACLASFCQPMPEYSYRQLLGFEEDLVDSRDYQEDLVDYSEIYQRYTIENLFLDAITAGDVNGIMKGFEALTHQPKSVLEIYRSTVYQDPSSILRTLARKAAEKSGLSVVTIDEITQRNVHKMSQNDFLNHGTSLIAEMILELTQAVADYKKNTAGLSPAVKKTVEFIQLNYSQNITMEDLTHHVGYSASHLSKCFKEETGLTITEYIAQKRCEKAADLLKNSDLAIQEIGNYVGYPDNNYFARIFKKQFGQSPSAYRNS